MVAVSLSCPYLYGQQEIAARAFADTGFSSSIVSSSAPEVYSSSVARSIPKKAATAGGFPQTDALYESMKLPSAETACVRLEALAEGSSQQNAFEHLDFHPAAIRSAFTHENLVKMAQNFKPGYSAAGCSVLHAAHQPCRSLTAFCSSTYSSDTVLGAGLRLAVLAGHRSLPGIWRRHGRIWQALRSGAGGSRGRSLLRQVSLPDACCIRIRAISRRNRTIFRTGWLMPPAGC